MKYQEPELNIINALFYLILITTLKANYLHFTDEEMEAWRV